MIQEIKTLKDVEKFIEQIAGEINDFHPLDDFHDYVYPDSHMRRYSDEEASNRNILLEWCFDICTQHTDDLFTYLLNLFQLEKASLQFEQK